MPQLNDAALAFYLGQGPTQMLPGAGTDRSATVGTSSATLIARNDARKKFFIKNDGANNVWINFGPTATAVAGGGNFKLASGGGYFEFTGYTGVISAIAETASVNVTAREF